MRFYTTQILSAKQELTPEGFLVCKAVPIARTGTMLYAAGEVPVTADQDGIIRIERLPEHVFAPHTIASFEGKAITIDHPTEDVNPDNWAHLAKGIIQNVRRGTGIEDDCLLADLLITEKQGIRQIRGNGAREVSCGYDADYEEIEPGRGRQTNIIGNHLALVEKGRCGSRCAIGDKAPIMKTRTKWIDRLRAAFKARDEEALEKVLNEEEITKDGEEAETEEEKKKREADEEKKKTSDAIASLSARVAKLEGTKDKKAKDEEGSEEEEGEKDEEVGKNDKDADGKTSDSAALLNQAQDVIARIEILSPGLQIPTFDAAAAPGKTRDALCQLRRKALEAAMTGKNRDAVTPFLGQNPDFKTLTCDAASHALIGASEIVRRENNARIVSGNVTFDGSKNAATVAKSISDINRRNAAFWTRAN